MCLSPVKIKYSDNYKNYRGTLIHAYNEGQILPCGRCYECKEFKIEEWQIRWKEHLKTVNPELSQFITLTYSDNNLPQMITPDGELISTLDYTDVQKFLKRIRKHQFTYCKKNNIENPKISYHGCGEYGKRYTKRPHYHILITNCLLSQEQISKIWGNGIVHFGNDVTENSIKYILKYTLKNSLSNYKTKKVYEVDEKIINIEPFELDSKTQFIANLLDKNPDLVKKKIEIQNNIKLLFKYYLNGENQYRVAEKSFCSKGIGKSFLDDKTIQEYRQNPLLNYLWHDEQKNSYKQKPLPRYYKELIFNPKKRDENGQLLKDENNKYINLWSPKDDFYHETPRYKKQSLQYKYQLHRQNELLNMLNFRGYDEYINNFRTNKITQSNKRILSDKLHENRQIYRNEFLGIAQLI